MWKNWKKKLSLVLLLLSSWVHSLPDIPSLNDCPDIIYNSGFQNDSNPSNGVGGLFPGSFSRFVFFNGSNRNYHIYIPNSYDPNYPIPLLFSWHGAAGAGTAEINARATRDFWASFSEQNNVIIVAQEGTGTLGGGFTFPNDIAILYEVLDDMYASYNIERTRVYGHGFSSGGHLMHTLMLFYNRNYAGYIISAGNFADALFEDPNVPANSSVVPVFVSVGSLDPMLARIQSEKAKFLSAGWVDGGTYWLDVFAGGHQLDIQVTNKSWDKLCTISNVQ